MRAAGGVLTLLAAVFGLVGAACLAIAFNVGGSRDALVDSASGDTSSAGQTLLILGASFIGTALLMIAIRAAFAGGNGQLARAIGLSMIVDGSLLIALGVFGPLHDWLVESSDAACGLGDPGPCSDDWTIVCVIAGAILIVMGFIAVGVGKASAQVTTLTKVLSTPGADGKPAGLDEMLDQAEEAMKAFGIDIDLDAASSNVHVQQKVIDLRPGAAPASEADMQTAMDALRQAGIHVDPAMFRQSQAGASGASASASPADIETAVQALRQAGIQIDPAMLQSGAVRVVRDGDDAGAAATVASMGMPTQPAAQAAPTVSGGLPGRATLVSHRSLGIQDANGTLVELELDVTLDSDPPYRVHHTTSASPSAQTRIVRGATFAVSIDPSDHNKLTVLWDRP